MKTLIEVSLRCFLVLRNFDDVLRLRDLKCHPFLAGAWPARVEFSSLCLGVKTDLVATFSNCCDGMEWLDNNR